MLKYNILKNIIIQWKILHWQQKYICDNVGELFIFTLIIYILPRERNILREVLVTRDFRYIQAISKHLTESNVKILISISFFRVLCYLGDFNLILNMIHFTFYFYFLLSVIVGNLVTGRARDIFIPSKTSTSQTIEIVIKNFFYFNLILVFFVKTFLKD